MSGYLNNFMGYLLNFFKKENRTISDASVFSTPPRRCNSVIEKRKIKEDVHNSKKKSVWSSTDGKINQQPRFAIASRCPNKNIPDPAVYGRFPNQNEVNTRQINERGDGLNSPKDCWIYHDAAISKEYPHYLPPSARRPQHYDHFSHGLKRSFSLESCCPTEDQRRLSGRKMSQIRPNLSSIDRAGDFSLDLDKGYSPFKELIDITPGKHSESSNASQSMFVEDHRPKASRIPTFRRKYRPACVSKSLPKQFKSTAPKEPQCTCYREVLDSPLQRSWRMEGHAFYCPKSVVAYRSYLNTKLENLFRMISKKKYCGNIIDAASHSRWMKLAGGGVDEDAAHFKQYAKGRVVLPVGEYKGALQNICSERNLEYWELLQKMTDIEIGSGESNSTIGAWKGSK